MRRILAAGMVIYSAGAIRPARAQLINQDFPTDIPGYEASFNASVLDRMIQQQQSDGVEVDNFVLRPQFSEAGGYDSNTLGAPHTASGEVLTQAGMRVNSDWTRNNFGASVSVDDHRFTSLPAVSYTNWTTGLGGNILLGNDTLTLGYSHLAEHLTATDLGQTGVLTPVPYSVDDARLAYEKLLGRFSLTPGFDYNNYQFGKSGGALVVNDSSLNHQVETERLTARYELAPGEGLVGIVRTSQSQYGNSSGDGYFDGGIYCGLDYTPAAIIQWRALAAFETRRFRASSAQDINTPVFELDGIWMPTELDTITGTAFRQIADPNSAFGRNQIVTEVQGEIDHELRTDVFIKADAHYGRSVTQSSIAGVSDGTDTQLSLGTAIWWNVNRHMSLKLSDELSNNKSTGGLVRVSPSSQSPDYTSNVILLGLRIYD